MLTAIDHGLLWLRALAHRLHGTARLTWQWATPPELMLSVSIVAAAVVMVIGAVVGGAPWLLVHLVGSALWVWLAALNLTDHARERRDMASVISTKPVGAPAMATVVCKDGKTRHFFYGPGGWQETERRLVE